MKEQVATVDIINSVMIYLKEDKPSKIVPFNGDFPLLKPWREDMFWKEVSSTPYYSDLSDWAKEIVSKATKIKSLDNGFEAFLVKKDIYNQFKHYDSEKKTKTLFEFFDDSCTSEQYLNI